MEKASCNTMCIYIFVKKEKCLNKHGKRVWKALLRNAASWERPSLRA